jgi:hypothetical protein
MRARPRSRVVADWVRLLRPGGRLLFTDPFEDSSFDAILCIDAINHLSEARRSRQL